jgi:hypothetical protein
VLHDEVDSGASFAASKTFEDSLRRGNGERRGFFIVERTQSQIIDPPPFQVNKIGNHLCYFSGINNPFDSHPVNHTTKLKN